MEYNLEILEIGDSYYVGILSPETEVLHDQVWDRNCEKIVSRLMNLNPEIIEHGSLLKISTRQATQAEKQLLAKQGRAARKKGFLV